MAGTPLLEAFDWQAAWCRPTAPFTARVLERSRRWLALDAAAHDALAAERARTDAPLAWLRLEPRASDGMTALRCRLWPDGTDRLLARCHPHASRIEWLATPDGAAEAAP
ncbi:MAG: DUF2332 family protein [Burkholderiales bacterium]|nr:DUF2332 family protein [Burkholderiales bacterium]MDE2566064.1 DUF2332 family protein [Burkholderiales bacterium]